MQMKKSLLMISSVAVVLGASAYGVANADDNTPAAGNAKGNTYITFTPPTTGQLTLDKVPTYDFGSNQLSTTTTKFNTTGNNPYTATNLTGNNAGYTITANAGNLTNSDAVLPVSDLLVSAADGTVDPTTKGQLSGAQNVNIYNASNKVATGNASSNGTLSSGNTSAVMDLSTANGIKSGKYTGTIDYTITNGIN